MTTTIDAATANLLRSRLLDLARRQDELAAYEAAATPYWKPQAPAVHGRRTAADVLRAEADRLLDAS
ncbi:hypothetical protein [Nocardioides antri]|uniref:Uncharacterized protein n=1 Tax=Nocardioides antri TaxID=2607659 RepID=A0A5B1M791_9ACTN|nr:hypothetical protein [Nocardioides antri]KAA1428663.1 hypothetical protein F0U47_00090 [Nocardioides antri]